MASSLCIAMNSGLNRKMAKRDWSMLLDVLLGLILARLDLADHVRFTAVCKNWRSVAAVNPADSKPFSLVYSNDPERLIHRLVDSFSNSWKKVSFIGSFEGWLVLLLDFESLVLVNPSSGEAPIPLPPLGIIGPTTPKVVISSTPTGKYLVAINHGHLSFWRPGDTAWTPFYPLSNEFIPISDMVFYKDQLYAINWEGVLVFDSGLNSNPRFCFKAWGGYLVNVSDVLLWIDTKLWIDRKFPKNPFSIKLSQIDPRRDSSPLEVKSLGGNIVFLSIFGTVCLPAKDHPEFRPNHIYMQDGPRTWHSFSVVEKSFTRTLQYGPRTLHYFSVVEKSITRATHRERRPIFFNLFRKRGFNKLTGVEKLVHNSV